MLSFFKSSFKLCHIRYWISYIGISIGIRHPILDYKSIGYRNLGRLLYWDSICYMYFPAYPWEPQSHPYSSLCSLNATFVKVRVGITPMTYNNHDLSHTELNHIPLTNTLVQLLVLANYWDVYHNAPDSHHAWKSHDPNYERNLK